MTAQIDPQAQAEAIGRELYARDNASQALGMTLEEIRPGYARMRMTVRADMVNGHDLAHGGLIFTLADSTFAFACNSHNHVAVAQGATIEFLAPGRLGDVLTAAGREQHSAGRTGVYDIAVTNQDGRTVALFRGKSFRLGTHILTPPPGLTSKEGGAMSAHDHLEHIEKASLDELRHLQLERLKSTLRHAYDSVPHYRKKFDAQGVRPDDLKRLEDLAQFPFTTKQDLRENYPFGMFAVPMEKIVRVHASSGTTGKPTVVGYTKGDIHTWALVMARSIRAAGGRSTDKIHVAYGYGLFTGGLGAHYGGELLGACVIPLGGGMTERQVQLIDDFKPDIIMVTPSYMLAIADEFERQGLDAKRSSLRVGIFGAEPWTEGMREEIERRMGLTAVDIYGLSEVMGPGVAQECIESKDGLTIWEDHFFPEIVDPATGDVMPDGRSGELVFTSLTKEALPVIRYRTRDLTALLPGTARTMRRMGRITGRSDDMLIIRGVNVFPTQIEELITKQPRLSPHYVLEVRREGRLDELDVIVEARADGATPLGEAERTAEAKALEHNIKSFIGVSTRVKVVEPGRIERSQGKAKRVIDLRPKG